MKTKRLPVFVGIAAVIMALAMSFAGCDDNEEPMDEYLKYAWFIEPDTARGEDGKLYFQEKFRDKNNGFVDSITGIRFRLEDYPHWKYNEYVSRVYKVWGLSFEMEGSFIRPSNNYPLFREYCIKFGVRPFQRTPFDVEMQKVLPCLDDWSVNGNDLCCESIQDISIITQRDFDANHPAGSDIADVMTFSCPYLDEYVAWYKANYTEYPKSIMWYLQPDNPLDVPYSMNANNIPIPEYTKAPHSLILNRYFGFHLKTTVIPQLPGDYPFTVTITLSNGRKVSAVALVKVV